MKLKTLALTVLMQITCLLSTVYSQGILFYQGSLKEAKEAAREKDKLIFIDAYTVWCGPCKWMDANVFIRDDVGAFYNEHFISLKLDMEKEGDGADVLNDYNIKAFPTFLIINQNGEMLHRAVGSLNPERFLSFGEIALDPNQRLSVMKTEYESGNRSPAFVHKYMISMDKAGIDISEVGYSYLDSIPHADLVSKEHFVIISMVVDDSRHPIFQHVLNNYEQYVAVASQNAVDEYLNTGFRKKLLLANDKGKEEYMAAVNSVRNSGFSDAERTIAIANISVSARNKDWPSFIDAAVFYIEHYARNSPVALNNLAYSFYTNERIIEESALEQALQWSKKAMELENNYKYIYTHAALLFKIGDYEEALFYATEAQSLAEDSGDNFEANKTLINQIKFEKKK